MGSLGPLHGPTLILQLGCMSGVVQSACLGESHHLDVSRLEAGDGSGGAGHRVTRRAFIAEGYPRRSDLVVTWDRVEPEATGSRDGRPCSTELVLKACLFLFSL